MARGGWITVAVGALLALLAGCRPDEQPLTLVINEVLAANDGAWTDPDGDPGPDACPEADDYVELFNPTGAAVTLGGATLADSGDTPLVLPPVTLGPGEYLLVVADEAPGQGSLHAPFGVSRDGETLVLRDADGRVLDTVDVPPADANVAWARYGDGGTLFRAAPPTPGAANEGPPADPCLAADAVAMGFDDHTVDCIGNPAGFASLATTRAGLSVVKFEILGFPDAAARHAVFLDGRFFALHDEWYIFRMLNGETVEGEDVYTPMDGAFDTVDAIVDWASSVDLGALFPQSFLWLTPSGRLTSPRFYALALDEPRIIGAGTLVHAPTTPAGTELWAFELEYSDDITYEDLTGYFETLESQLGPALARDLRWLVRSPDQEALASRMEAEGLTYHDRIVRYDALSEPGTVEVYTEGTVAGRVKIVAAGEIDAIDALPTDILVLADVPDILPPCAALITSVPQTPLAHIALLAKSRGIPNLSIAGIASDPAWDAWSRVGAKVAIRATLGAEGPEFEAVALSDEDYTTWLGLTTAGVPSFPAVDGSRVAWTVDPALVPIDDLLELRPYLGGKSSGYVALLAAGVETPPDPLAVSIRAYQAQVDAMGFEDAVLASSAFAHPGDPRGRWLIVEGQDGYDDRFPEPGDATYHDTFLAENPPGSVVGDLVRSGGVRQRFFDTPVLPEILDEVLPVLQARFATLALTQGLRFRSSSNVEDIEGFVGAGLYLSETGFLDPEAAGSPSETVEAALQTVWGSYWGFEAVEERHAAAIPHGNGAMGVLVHPNFDDDAERANGVVTATRLPTGAIAVDVNAQIGAISVTNPPVDGCRTVLPEVDAVEGDPADPDAAVVTRRQPSTETDEVVLTDAELRALFAAVAPVVELWLGFENDAVEPAWARSTLSLDLEFRWVTEGWPEMADGAVLPSRLVLKQARSLEPVAVGLPDDVEQEPFPRDVLARARTITETTCTSASHTVVAVEATTDPALPPDLGYSTVPFTASIAVDSVVMDHLGFAPPDHPSLDPWSIEVIGAVGAPFASVAVNADTIAVDDGTTSWSEPTTGCTTVIRWASPATFLDDRLDGA